MTTALRKSLGPIPHAYKVEDPLNDYTVVINGPVGRAVITEVNGGEDYEIETKFDRQGLRLYHGTATARDALEQIIQLSNISLTMIGVAPPRRVSRRRLVVEAIAIAVVLVLAVLLVIFLNRQDSGEQPTAPVTWSPATTVTPSYDIPVPTPGAIR